MADAFAACNPHLTLDLRTPDRRVRHTSTDDNWINQRWSASKLSPGAWFDLERFRSLLGATVYRLGQRGESMTVRDWVSANFAGLTGSAKKSAVAERAGLSKSPLSALVKDGSQFDERAVKRLYEAVRETSTNISRPKMLGVIGEEHLRQTCNRRAGELDGLPDEVFDSMDGSFRYKVAYGFTDDERPFVVECAFIATAVGFREGGRVVLAGVNGSPSIDGCPFHKIDEYGCETFDGLLEDQECGYEAPVLIFAHIAIPRPDWDGYGKTRMRVPNAVGEKLKQALTSVTKDWCAQVKRERRDSTAELRRQEELERAENRQEEQVALDAAIYLKMEDGIQEASGGDRFEFPGRNLYYSVRDLIQEITDKVLTQKWFDKVLNRWQGEHGLIDKLYRDPRGHLVEPHTGNIVPLGTREVLQYHVPEWLYHTLLYIEKKGFLPMIKSYAVPERYDMGIVAAEGYATEAAKMLMAKAAESGEKMLLACMRDADPYGKLIHQKLCDATLRSPQIEVVDIGLTIEDGLALGLTPENFIRKKALPKRLELTPLEKEWWEGEPHGHYKNKAGKWKEKFLCKRIELNSLAKNPDAFIGHLEMKLEQAGCARKVVPPNSVITDLAKSKRMEIASSMAQAEVERLLDIDSIVDEVASEICKKVSLKSVPREVREWGRELNREHWRDVASRAVRVKVQAKSEALCRLVAERVRGGDVIT